MNLYAASQAIGEAAVRAGSGAGAGGADVANAVGNITTKIVSSSQDMSVFGLFCKAEFLVQFIIVGLLLASVWSWTIIINKIQHIKRREIAANAFEELFWNSDSLENLYVRINNRPTDPLMTMFCAAMREWRHAIAKGPPPPNQQHSLEQRIDRVMQLAITREISDLERYCSFLATLGSNGMIIGLFGTVLGIMHSFQPIASQQSANLAVVAPGIAEALLATAVGLIAAIPAAIAYNYISNSINRYISRLDVFANEIGAIIARQLSES
ncbi:MAG: protein TolQ [Holosporales bacterium]|jgi:biopolymer transport protein TolQ|nr:protein TolQ [Holosporales bacterium]